MTLKLRQAQRRCHAALRRLELPIPFTLTAFCAGLSGQRHRPVELLPVSTQPSPRSLWIAGRSKDWIVYDHTVPPVCQQLLVLRQLGHVLLDHLPSVRADDDVTLAGMLALLPDLDPDLVQQLHLHGHAIREPDPAEVAEADMLGWMLLQRIAPPQRRSEVDDPQTAAELHRLALVLEGPDR